MEGVIRTRVGYGGGNTESPTYHNLGDHMETIQLDYDPTKITYEDLLNIFMNSHSPEYPAYSRQYMSAIFFHNDHQRILAEEIKQKEEMRLSKKLYTEVLPYTKFFMAENYHHKYYLQLIRELMGEYREIYPNMDDFIGSTSAARVNGYIKGYGTMASLKKGRDNLGLSETAYKRLTEIVKGYGR